MSELKNKIIEEIKKIYDPEIPVNIYELGLIYKIEFDEKNKKADIEMTLTSPNCPVAESLPNNVKENDLNLTQKISEEILGMIKNKEKITINSLTEDQITTISSLAGVQEFPMRVKCATMVWHTFLSALNKKN